MKNILKLSLFATWVSLLTSFYSCTDDTSAFEPDLEDSIALFSGVWLDSADTSRKITFANVEGTNQFIGTDEYYGDKGAINLNGITNILELSYTVIIKYQPPGFDKWYIQYEGIIDNTQAQKRIKVYSVLDTLVLIPK